MSFPTHFLSQGIGSTCGGILCLAEPGTIKLSSGSRSLSRARYSGKEQGMLALPSAQGRVSFSASWHRHAGAQPFCLWDWLCVSPGLVEAVPPALTYPAHTGAVAQCLVWPFLQVSAGKTCALGIWHSYQGFLEWWVCGICDVLLTFAPTPEQENGAAPGLGMILPMVVTMFCQYIGASAWPHCLLQLRNVCSRELPRSLLQRNQNAQWNWVHVPRCFIHVPGAVDQAGLNYTLPFTGVCWAYILVFNKKLLENSSIVVPTNVDLSQVVRVQLYPALSPSQVCLGDGIC